MTRKHFVALALITLANGAAVANDEVVRRLETFAQSFPTIVEKAPARIYPAGPGEPEWFRRKVYVSDIGFDVRRTDSLVSPFAGEILYNCSVRGARGASEGALTTGRGSFDYRGGRCKAAYAYQSSRWVLKSVSCLMTGSTSWKVVESADLSYFLCASLLPQD